MKLPPTIQTIGIVLILFVYVTFPRETIITLAVGPELALLVLGPPYLLYCVTRDYIRRRRT